MNVSKERGRQWTWAATKPGGVPEAVKDAVTEGARRLVETTLKPAHVKPPRQGERFNYIVDIFTKWRGRYFFFLARYACPGLNALSPFFETGFARLEYLADGRFNVAYMRHTGKWSQVYPGLTLDEAIETVGTEPLFHL